MNPDNVNEFGIYGTGLNIARGGFATIILRNKKTDTEVEYTREQVLNALAFYQHIKDALGTDEDGMALVEVARNAHKAEQKLNAFRSAMFGSYGTE